MSIQQKESILVKHGYKIYSIQSGGFAVADPLDDEDGFYLECQDRDEAIDEAYDHVFLAHDFPCLG